MVHRRQGPQDFGVALLVADIGYLAAEVGLRGGGEDGVDFGLRGGDDGYVRAVFEEGEGGAVTDAERENVVSLVWCMVVLPD